MDTITGLVELASIYAEQHEAVKILEDWLLDHHITINSNPVMASAYDLSLPNEKHSVFYATYGQALYVALQWIDEHKQ